MRGMRPIAEIMYIDFLTISSDQLIHNLGYNRYMFGGKTKVPAVVRTEGGVGRSHRRAPLREPGSDVHAHPGPLRRDAVHAV